MGKHLLLVVGTALIGVALVAGAVSSTPDSVGFSGWNGFNHMFDRLAATGAPAM